MSNNKKPEKKPFALLCLWYAADSSRPLGFGIDANAAYADAVARHGEIPGYSVHVLLTGFPEGANPAPAIVFGLREQWPPTRVEAGAIKPDVEEKENVKPIKGKAT